MGSQRCKSVSLQRFSRKFYTATLPICLQIDPVSEEIYTKMSTLNRSLHVQYRREAYTLLADKMPVYSTNDITYNGSLEIDSVIQ